MKALLGLSLALTLVAAPLGAAPWSLPYSDVVETTASDGHTYTALIAWPQGEPPKQGWPVLWLLDGEDNFAIAAMTARRLARAHGRSGIEPGVIVAIDSGPLARRVEDYTPQVPGYSIAPGRPASGLPLGGADTFLAFINKQLRPMIEARLPIDPARQTLAGHSFGGLLALYAAHRGEEYERYAAISPSLWYGGARFHAGEPPAASTSDKRLLIASGPGPGDAGPHGTKQAEAIVTAWHARGYEANYLPLPGQTHGSTMLAAMAQIVDLAFHKES